MANIGELVARAQGAGRLQYELVIVYVFAALPYVAYGFASDVGAGLKMLGILFGTAAALLSVSVGVRRGFGIHKTDLYAILGERADLGGMKVDDYVNWLAGADLILLFVAIVTSGGLTSSGFVPFMFVVPAFAMLYKSTALRTILWIATGCLVALAALKCPWILRGVLDMVGVWPWVPRLDGRRLELAYTWSISISTIPSVWALHFQYRLQRAVDRAREHDGEGAKS